MDNEDWKKAVKDIFKKWEEGKDGKQLSIKLHNTDTTPYDSQKQKIEYMEISNRFQSYDIPQEINFRRLENGDFQLSILKEGRRSEHVVPMDEFKDFLKEMAGDSYFSDARAVYTQAGGMNTVYGRGNPDKPIGNFFEEIVDGINNGTLVDTPASNSLQKQRNMMQETKTGMIVTTTPAAENISLDRTSDFNNKPAV